MLSNLDIALTFFFVVFVIIDIFVNVVLCKAIFRKRSLQTPMNLLIFHLAISDIVIGVFIIPRHILSYAITYPNSTSSDYICRLATGGGCIWTSVIAASGFLTIIALERLFAVVFPHKSKLRITKQRLKWLVPACWLSSLAFNLPSQLVLKYDHDMHFCLENWPEWVNPKAYVGIAFIAGNFSVFAMYIIYSVILYSLWKKNKGVSEVSRTARINARKRVTKMLILMTVVHMLCRTPNYTFYTLIYFDPDAQYGSIVYNFTVFLILLNSASHPFFYCWYMHNLRKQVLAMLPQVCLGRCPTKLRTFNLATTTGDEIGSATPESRRSKGEAHMHSCTIGSETEEEMTRKINKIKMVRGRLQGEVNKEMEVSNNSSGQPSRKATPVAEKKKLNLNISNGCENNINNQVQSEEKTEEREGNNLNADESKEEKCYDNSAISDSNESDNGQEENNKDQGCCNEDKQNTNENEQSVTQDASVAEATGKQDKEEETNDNNNSDNVDCKSNNINENASLEEIILETDPVHV